MKLGETNPLARRIGPLKAVDVDGNPVTDFSALGTVTVKVNNGAFIAAGGTVVVIPKLDTTPSGYVYYLATASDASVRGFLAVKLAGPCLEQTFREEVELAPQGIPVGTTDTSLLTIGPLEAKDGDGNPVLGGVGIDVEVCINGDAWSIPGGALVEVSDGYYDYRAPPSEATSRGWLAVKLSGSCQEFVLRATVVAETIARTSSPLSTSQDSTAVDDRVAGDLALTWSNATTDADVSLVESTLVPGLAADLATDEGLTTAVILSLFTDRRAETDDKPPSGDARDRRGWWADQFTEVDGDRIGSRLWLLDRSKRTNETVLRAKEYVREALAWMLEDRVVSSIDVEAETTAAALLIAIGLQRPGRDPVSFRFAHAWDHLQETA